MENTVTTLKRDEIFSLTHFLAMCGGLLGLFLGVSMLSIIEFFYFISIHLFWTLKHRSLKSMHSVKPLGRTMSQLNYTKREMIGLRSIVDEMQEARSSKH